MSLSSKHLVPTVPFGIFLKQLRKRAGMTQSDLAAALGYSDSLISGLEKAQRLPDLDVVAQRFIPALGLQEEPSLAARLIESAASARGERVPVEQSAHCIAPLAAQVRQDRLPYRLPPPSMPLLGRDKEIKELSNRMLGHQGRLLTLLGPPGVGKTRLAQAVGLALQECFSDGACFVPLASVNDPGLLASALLAALQLSQRSTKSPKTRLVEALRHKEMLLVLDNFEQFLGAAQDKEESVLEMITVLLSECTKVRILVTSRERLYLRTEQRYKVQPLSLSASVELFVKRVQAFDGNFLLTLQNRAAIEAICRKLDCLPLAIELSAAQCEFLLPAQLLKHLQTQPLDLLSERAYDIPERQRSLRLAIHHSYAALSAIEQRLFRILGLFAGGFDLQAVEHFGFQMITLQRLVYKSLVADGATDPELDDTRRFFLLETIRIFALEQLAATNETESVYQQFLEFFVVLTKKAAKHKEIAARKLWRLRLRQENDNLRMALQIALQQNATESAAHLVNHLYWFWYYQGQIEEGRAWARRVLQQLATINSPLFYAETLFTAGKLAEIQGEWKSALHHFQTSMQLYQLTNDEENFVKTQASYGEALLDTGEETDALHCIEDCLKRISAWQTTQDNYAIGAHVYEVYARILLRKGELSAARLQFEKSMRSFQQAHDQSGYAYLLYSLAQVDMRQGRTEEARAKYSESLEIFLEDKSDLLAANDYYFLGYLDRLVHQNDSALQNLRNGLKLFIRIGNVGSIVGCTTEIAKVAMHKLRYSEACRLFGKADFLRESIGEKQWKALPSEREEYDRNIELLRRSLGADHFTLVWNEGQKMTIDEISETVAGL